MRLQSGGAYGRNLGRAFRQPEPLRLTATTAAHETLAVTEIRFDEDDFGMTLPIPRSEAYLIGLQLRPMRHHEFWLDGRPIPAGGFAQGTVAFRELERDPVCHLAEPFHSLQFYIPRAALEEVALELGCGRIRGLASGDGYLDDPVVRALGMSLLPALRAQQQTNQLFVDHVLLALRNHLVATYGAPARRPKPAGGLAPWQQRRATELMRSNLSTGIGLAELAAACGLSPSRFLPLFKQSMGVTPHRWLLMRRVEQAMDLMRDGDDSLADIAQACGFADQSHLARTFRQSTGVSPGVWRSRAGAH